MSYMTKIVAADAALQDVFTSAMMRAPYSYFPQHIVRDDDGTCWVADEGSYEGLITGFMDRIVATIPAGRSDES